MGSAKSRSRTGLIVDTAVAATNTATRTTIVQADSKLNLFSMGERDIEVNPRGRRDGLLGAGSQAAASSGSEPRAPSRLVVTNRHDKRNLSCEEATTGGRGNGGGMPDGRHLRVPECPAKTTAQVRCGRPVTWTY